MGESHEEVPATRMSRWADLVASWVRTPPKLLSGVPSRSSAARVLETSGSKLKEVVLLSAEPHCSAGPRLHSPTIDAGLNSVLHG